MQSPSRSDGFGGDHRLLPADAIDEAQHRMCHNDAAATDGPTLFKVSRSVANPGPSNWWLGKSD